MPASVLVKLEFHKRWWIHCFLWPNAQHAFTKLCSTRSHLFTHPKPSKMKSNRNIVLLSSLPVSWEPVARMSQLLFSKIYGPSVLTDYSDRCHPAPSQGILCESAGKKVPVFFYLCRVSWNVIFLPGRFLPISPWWVSQLRQASKPHSSF